MTSFGKIRRYMYLATSAGNPCFALYVIHLVILAPISYIFGIDALSRMNLVCYVYIF